MTLEPGTGPTVQDQIPPLPEFRRILDRLDPDAPPEAVLLRRCGTREPGTALGVLSASFNPPTRAHLRMVELAAATFGLDEVLLLLAKTNVDKAVYGAALEARMAMLEALAVPGTPYSLALVNRARFVDKLKALRPHYPRGTELRFVVGYDTLVRLFDRKYYSDMEAELEPMFSSCRFVAVNRGDDDLETVRSFLGRTECRRFAARIDTLLLEPHFAAMSSSLARERLLKGESVDGLVPEEVKRVIQRLGLYRRASMAGGG